MENTDNRIKTENPTATLYRKISDEIHKVIVGQDRIIESILTAFFTGGHVLLEGVPGIAKTLIVKVLSKIIGCRFERIQFTPDMMPSDVVGTHVFDIKTGEFYLKKGPVYTNLLLADEINRTPPKTQSALLEAMEELQVTIEGEKVPLPEPFMVLATQNPIEFEGTYPLPEAQMDRFLFKILIEYPTDDQEVEILKRYHQGFDPRHLESVPLKKFDYHHFLGQCRDEILKVKVKEDIFDYIVRIIKSTRKGPGVSLGASPRGSIALLLASKTRAAIKQRDYIIPDDVKETACIALRHRIMLKPEAEIEGTTPDDIIKRILDRLEVPR